MAKREIEAAIREWESARDSFMKLEAKYYEAEKGFAEANRGLREKLVGSYGDEGYLKVNGVVYRYGCESFYPITVNIIDLDTLPDSDVSDHRCVKTINPDLDPADLAGIGCIDSEVS